MKNTCRKSVGNSEEKRPLGDPGAHGRIILKWMLKETRCDSAVWIQLAQDGIQWRALVNTVMDLRVV
jgi:hypothetical protein